jgi:UDP-N-acetylglucosamine 1-carboxyvinyltransferase
MHLKALEKMGAEIKVERGYITAQAQRLKGTNIIFEKKSVTGTENIIMAASLAKGKHKLKMLLASLKFQIYVFS